jgi:hypothetical protein
VRTAGRAREQQQQQQQQQHRPAAHVCRAGTSQHGCCRTTRSWSRHHTNRRLRPYKPRHHGITQRVFRTSPRAGWRSWACCPSWRTSSCSASWRRPGASAAAAATSRMFAAGVTWCACWRTTTASLLRPLPPALPHFTQPRSVACLRALRHTAHGAPALRCRTPAAPPAPSPSVAA